MCFIKSSIHKLIRLACVVTTPIGVIAQDEIPRRLPLEANVALALGGGGFLSTAEMTGFTAGLLSVLMKKNDSLGAKNNGEDSLLESGLFSRVESINSISGGSWFASKLIYSKNFRRMIETLAFAKAKQGACVAEVSEIYRKEDSFVKLADLAENAPVIKWLDNFYRVFSKLADDIVKSDILPERLPEALKQALGWILIIAKNEALEGSGDLKPLKWETVVKYILDDIENYKFGDDVQVSCFLLLLLLLTFKTASIQKTRIPYHYLRKKIK